MNVQQTLAIIKPKAFAAGHTGPMITQIEQKGFKIKAIASLALSIQDAQAFYAVHAEKPFYQQLCEYMASGTVVVMVLERENAVEHFREVIGATNPAEAAPGTLRKQFGISIDYNAVHGSDSPQNATNEIRFFFGTRGGGCCGGSCAS